MPDKNISEIETAKPLSESDTTKEFISIKITKFWEHDNIPSEIKNLLKGEFRYDGEMYENQPTDKGLRNKIKELGYKGNYTGYIFSKAEAKRINKNGLFICAPPSHFDLKTLSKEGELGYFKVEKWEINDPIVFRYCKGGVQVISKWGLEASDEALVNEINN